MTDDGDEPRRIAEQDVKTAEAICELLVRRKLHAGHGCSVLALAYGIWIEQQPDGLGEHVTAMLVRAQHSALLAFNTRRAIRNSEQALLDAAFDHCFGDKPRKRDG